MILQPGIHLDIPHETYLNDPCEVPSLSSHLAGTLVNKSALHAWHSHPRYGGDKHESSYKMTDGTIFHELVLGGDRIVEINADDFKTKIAKEARDEALAAGKAPILAYRLPSIRKQSDATKSAILETFGPYKTEVTLVWKWEGITLRARPDIVTDAGVIVDLKTCSDVTEAIEGSYVHRYGYHIQEACYTEGATATEIQSPGRESFVFLFQEIEAPFGWACRKLDGQFQELGRRQWKRAKYLWQQCQATNKWPGVETHGRIEAPQWALVKDSEQQSRSIAGGSKDVSF